MKKRNVERISTAPSQIVESSLIQSRPSEFKQETESALYRLGGGTLGEIWKLSKRKKGNDKLNIREKGQYLKCYDFVFRFKMNNEENLENLDEELLIRDAGGMFFPKPVFLPFIRSLNESVRQSANTEALQKYGRNMIKVCVAEVTNTSAIKELFSSALQDLNIPENEPELEFFYKVWTRKMTHARVQEFISSHTSQNIGKGGHMLRDSLFAQSKKQKSGKTLSTKKGGNGTNCNLTSRNAEKKKGRKALSTKQGKKETNSNHSLQNAGKNKTNFPERNLQKNNNIAKMKCVLKKTTSHPLITPQFTHQTQQNKNAVLLNSKPIRPRKKLIFEDFSYD